MSDSQTLEEALIAEHKKVLASLTDEARKLTKEAVSKAITFGKGISTETGKSLVVLAESRLQVTPFPWGNFRDIDLDEETIERYKKQYGW